MNKSNSFLNTEEISFYLKDVKKIPTTNNKRLKEIIHSLKQENITEKEKSAL